MKKVQPDNEVNLAQPDNVVVADKVTDLKIEYSPKM
jgi:hypothetical protein